MYSDKRNVRGIKRKLTDNEDDEQHTKPKTKFKEHDRLQINLDDQRSDADQFEEDQRIVDALGRSTDDDLNDKENNELTIDFIKQTDDEIEFNNNQPISAYAACTIADANYQPDDLNDNLKGDESDENHESFNCFLNTSLSQCYVNSRPLTPLPQLNTTTVVSNEQQTTEHDQRIQSNSSSDSQTQQPQSSNQTNCSTSSVNQSSLNGFPALISNTKLFNSTSSSLFSAAAIVDTYFSSTTKKSKLEKAKNMNHFRYSLFNKSLVKLNKFCNSSDPNIRKSVLVCNTLKRLERQLRKENIHLHLTANGLAFIKLKNKHSSPDQLDYRNLVLDETSQLYVEKNANDDEESDSDNEQDDDRFGIDTDLDFNAAKQNDSSCSSDSDELDDEDQSDELSDDLNELNEYDEIQTNLDQESSPFLEQSTDSLCNNELNPDLSTYLSPATNSSIVNNISLSSNGSSSSSSTITNVTSAQTNWTEESLSNQFNWTNMFTNLTLCRENEQFENGLVGLGEQSEKSAESKDDELDNNSYLFNSIDQSVGQTSSTSTDELFSDIDSLITLYDFDLLTSVANSTKQSEQTSEQQTNTLPNDQEDDNETKCSTSSQDSDTTVYTLDSAIGSINSSISTINSSINSSLNSSSTLNNSINNSATSCSTSASVNSSSTSFASNQANNTISPVIS